MSCQHREDVCQHCLEKVQKTTELSMPDNEDTTPYELGVTTEKKLFSIFLSSSLIAANAAFCYWLNKQSLKTIASLFDCIVNNIEAPTKKRKKE